MAQNTATDAHLADLYAAAVAAQSRPAAVIGNRRSPAASRVSVAAGCRTVAAARRRGIDWRLIAAVVAAAVVAAPLAFVLAMYF